MVIRVLRNLGKDTRKFGVQEKQRVAKPNLPISQQPSHLITGNFVHANHA